MIAVFVGWFALEERCHFLAFIFSLAVEMVDLWAFFTFLVSVVAKVMTDIAPIGLEILSYAFQAILIVLCILSLF